MTAGPAQPVLLVNPRSGGGKAARFDLVAQCRARGIEAIMFEPGDDLTMLATAAVRDGADALGMAGGDGSQAAVAAVAAEHGLPYVCIPAGTRNHFALDLGIDATDVAGALDAFLDGQERRIDLGRVNGRLFVNNVAMGVYGAIVQSPAYRDHKVRTVIDMLPELVGPGAQPFDLRFNGPDGRAHDSAALLLVSNNPYGVDPRPQRGTRGDLDGGVLGVIALAGPPPRRSDRMVDTDVSRRLGDSHRARDRRRERRDGAPARLRVASVGVADPHAAPPSPAMSENADGRRRGGALVGRAAERETIDTLLAAAEDAQSGALVLAGPPGIGKSALVQYAIDSACGFRVLRVTGVESEMAFGYAGVHQLVLPILESARHLPEPQRAALDAVLGTVQHDALDPFLAGLAVLSLVAEAARDQSVLIVVDDAQWLDDESAMALSFVGRRLRAERVAMLVAVREMPEPAVRFEGLRRLDLGGTAPSRRPSTSCAPPLPVPSTTSSPAASSTQRKATRSRSSSSLPC